MTDTQRPATFSISKLMDEVTDTQRSPAVENAGRQARPLTEFLPALGVELADAGAAGGVPLPEAWDSFRAIIGGVMPRDLYAFHDEQDPNGRGDRVPLGLRVKEAQREGSHLPAGLHVFTGQTGGGKTAVAVNLLDAAARAGHPVLYVSLELDESEVAARLVGLRAGLKWSDLARRRPLTFPGARDKRDATIADLAADASRIHVLAPALSIPANRVAADALDLWREFGKVPLVVFDYLQLAQMRVENADRVALREHLGAVTLELRALSRHIPEEPTWPGCPVVVLSSTARVNVKRGSNGEGAVQGMDGRNPDMLRQADLETLKALPKEAGEIEATAVTAWVIALGETPRTENGKPSGPRPMTLRLAKNRYGIPGQWVPFDFDGITQRLTEAPSRYAIARREDEEAKAEREAERARKNKGKKEPATEWFPDTHSATKRAKAPETPSREDILAATARPPKKAGPR